MRNARKEKVERKMDKVDSVILEGLDPQQRLAVEAKDGPVLIVAGAGSGKTRVLTSRIAYILEQGCEPSRVLALTFTKKAATEMKERIAVMVGERSARRLYMGTFHAIFVRFLREYADTLGYPSSFTIWDTSDSTGAIKRCIKELGLDDKVYKPKDVLARISNAKNNLVTVAAYKANDKAITNDTAARKPRICDIYAAYQEMMRQAGVMDFDDILLNMNILLRDCPEALAEISGRFDYILVDEYQDTNFAQYLILKKLAKDHRNICVVGDDSQSIYAFRGARIENILNFKKDYPDAKTFRLEQNYRSTRNIVGAANSLIAKNEGRIPKECFSRGEEGDKIHLLRAYTESEEALLIASSIITRMQSDHAQYQDFAILYRTNSQSRALEEALRKRNLPYVIYSGNSFFERAEVKDMMAYLKLVANPSDNEAFRRIVNKPARGIGDTTIETLSAAAATAGIPLMEAAMLESVEGLKPAAHGKLKAFAEMILSHSRRLATTDAWRLATELSNACGLHRSFKEDNSIESQSRAANIEELLNSVSAFVEDRHASYIEDMLAEGTVSDMSEVDESSLPTVTLDQFLEDISLLSNIDMSDDGEDSSNKIALMTVHSAKGLEFPYVFVAGMEENLFPSGGMLAGPDDIEEERRLFYVALTRAKKAVELTFATTRMRNGRHESNSPSRFLREIDPQFVSNPLPRKAFDEDFGEEDDSTASGRAFGAFGSRGGFGSRPVGHDGSGYGQGPRGGIFGTRPGGFPRPGANLRPASAGTPPRTPDPDFIPVSVLDLKEGQRIEHNRFGFGLIKELSGSPVDRKARILFADYGEKILLLKYAKIRLA